MLVEVISNADDFGYTHRLNKDIIRCIEAGVVTSTSVMVDQPAAVEARELSENENISLGLHLVATAHDGLQGWLEMAAIFSWNELFIKMELLRQIEKFVDIVGRKPDHIDSHLHVHRLTPFRKIVFNLSRECHIPVRSIDAKLNIQFYGGWPIPVNGSRDITATRLIYILDRLGPGIHELMCHPGSVDNSLIKTGTRYLHQREQELHALTSLEFRDALTEKKDLVRFINWKDVALKKSHSNDPV